MKLKILMIDGSQTIRRIVAKAFKRFDCDFLEAAHGVEGLAVANREKPDLILLDLTMPIMDGAEVLSQLKSNPELKNIPVVILTAEAGRENVVNIAQLGVRDYRVKPFKEELKSKSARTLQLDTSSKYVQSQDGDLALKIPTVINATFGNDISTHLRAKISEAVNSGIDKVVIDLGQLKGADFNLVRLGLSQFQLCGELSIKHRIIGSDRVQQECKLYEDTKDWRFVGSMEAAKTAFATDVA